MVDDFSTLVLGFDCQTYGLGLQLTTHVHFSISLFSNLKYLHMYTANEIANNYRGALCADFIYFFLRKTTLFYIFIHFYLVICQISEKL